MTILTADTVSGGVNHSVTGATGGFHQLIAPQTATLPRIEFHELLTTALYSFRSLQADHVFYQIKALATDTPIGAGTTIAGNLSERARALLTDNSSMGLYCRFERSIPPYAEFSTVGSGGRDGRYIYHKGFICELWVA
jgi:hypothetical protein